MPSEHRDQLSYMFLCLDLYYVSLYAVYNSAVEIFAHRTKLTASINLLSHLWYTNFTFHRSRHEGNKKLALQENWLDAAPMLTAPKDLGLTRDWRHCLIGRIKNSSASDQCSDRASLSSCSCLWSTLHYTWQWKMTLITTLIFKSFPNWNDVGSQCYFKPRGKIEQYFEEIIVPIWREKTIYIQT